MGKTVKCVPKILPQPKWNSIYRLYPLHGIEQLWNEEQEEITIIWGLPEQAKQEWLLISLQYATVQAA